VVNPAVVPTGLIAHGLEGDAGLGQPAVALAAEFEVARPCRHFALPLRLAGGRLHGHAQRLGQRDPVQVVTREQTRRLVLQVRERLGRLEQLMDPDQNCLTWVTGS
jgi:hypothetical protein